MQSILSKYDEAVIEKASKIEMLIFDVDGVLTDGKIIYTNSGDEIKAFNVKDGQIIRFLKEAGIRVGVITGRSSALVERRCIELKLDFFHQG
ncbi:MAG: 3-deoxy-manno-octulosonate-8-phosphatase, partial [Bacteroidota bacterium]